MADVKWIKISTDLFDNRKIRQIESLPDGDKIIVIWVKLLCLAGTINDCGYIYFTKEIPYTEQMLATQFGTAVAIIKFALKTFEEFGMIEIIDDMLHISNWEKYKNVEGMERIREQTRARVAKHRELKKLDMQSNICSYCGGIATGYDHIIAVSRGGKDVESNKTPCCIECNRIKNDKPLIDFLNNNRDRINDSLIMGNTKLTKYVTLCNVTNRYIVTQGNATDKEEDIEKEKKEIREDNTPPLSPSRGKEPLLDMFNRLSEGKQLSEPLKDKLREWMQYKKEKKETYKETGLKSFLTQMEKHEQKYGSFQLIDCIDLCMARNYKGIITDLIDKPKSRNIDDDWSGVK